MVALNQTSIYHWLQRDDCNSEKLSVGYWQASRIQALLGNAAEATHFAEVCFSYSGALVPFYLGYAHEALARAHKLAGRAVDAKRHITIALDLAANIGKQSDRDLLDTDLRELSS
jgi:hypothetical protein